MIRLLHTADIHLDAPLKSLALRDAALREAVEAATRASLERMIELALSERVAALLIAGDLFDGQQRSARTAAFLIGQMDRLRSAGVRVFVIKGNHDAQNPITGAVNIAMLHTSLAGASGHDVYAPCALGDLTAMGFDYWALGHVHKRQVHCEAPWVVMPGMPQGRDIGEAGPKSASLLTIADGKIHVEEVPTSVVAFFASSLDITGAQSDDALRTLLRDHMRVSAQALTAPAGVMRLTLCGAPDRHWQILRDRDSWGEQISDLARETGCLWLDKLVFDLAEPQSQGGTASATEELSGTMSAIRDEPGFVMTARAEIDAVFQDLPPAVRARLLPDSRAGETLTDRLAEAGARRVLARMKGSER